MQQQHPASSHTSAQGIPPGGYVPIPVLELLRAWEAYRREIIGLRDLRAWLACHELVARRTAAQKAARRAVPSHYSESELHALLGGVGGEHVRASLRALTKAGLLEWSTTAVRFPTESLREPEPELDRLVTLVRNVRRAVPVPRRVLRYLAREGTRSVIAAMLGHLLRCAYRRRLSCSWRGRCSSAWVADLTGVDERSVKRARGALVGGGWLRGDAGSRTRPWLAEVWEVLAGPEPTGPSPVVTQSTTGLSPAREDKELLRSSKDQNPRLESGRPKSSTHALPLPNMRNIRPEDLRSRERLEVLWRQAVAAGQLGRGEMDRLTFFAMAARAARVGERNAPGMLVWLLASKCPQRISHQDEEAARSLLRQDCVRAPWKRTDTSPERAGSVATRSLAAHLAKRSRSGPEVGRASSGMPCQISLASAACPLSRSTSANRSLSVG